MQNLIASLKDLAPEKRKALAALLKKKGIDLFAQMPINPADRSLPLALSYAQQRLWFLTQLEPANSAYNIPGALRLRGRLDQDALQKVFDGLVARHESLRTRFMADADANAQPRQVIDAPTPVALTHIDLRGQGAEALAAAVEAEALQPFDLAGGPLLRVTLLTLADEEYALLLTLHHIIADGWSMKVLVDEFAAGYSACVQGHAVDLPALPVQYADYAQWQREWLEAGELQRQLDYWKAQLGDTSPVLELPWDFPRPALQSYRGARQRRVLGEGFGQRLRQFAQAQGSTTFQVLLAIFAVSLQRASGHSDLRIGVPTANRNRLEIEGLIGLFVNTQVLRCEVDNHGSFANLLEQVRERALGAQANQDLPFEQLVEALHPERSLSHNPLFQVLFNHQRQGFGALAHLPGLTLEALDQEETSAQFDLGLDSSEDDSGRIVLSFTYAVDLFLPASIERFAERFEALLRQVIEQPQLPLLQLAWLTDEEQRQLHAWSQSAGVTPSLPLVHDAISEQAALRPDAIALVCGDRSLAFAELESRANQLAHRLIALGVGRETLVGVALDRSLELILAPLAIIKAGGAYVPLDPEYPAERLAYMVKDSGLQLVLTDSMLALEWPEGVQALALDQLDISRESPEAPAVAIDPKQLAYMIYTSGSTGQPKGVTVEHGPLSMHCRAAAELYDMSVDDIALHFASISFDGAVEQWLSPMMFGARLVLRGPGLISAEQSYQTLVDEQVSIAYFPTSYAHQLAEWALAHPQDLALRSCTIGGEAVSRETFELLRRGLKAQRIINGYGPTETIVTPTLWRADGDVACDTPYAPIGHAVGNRTLYVLDADLNLLPPGMAGELYIGGEGLARGYHQRPDLTAERFVPDPFSTEGGRLYRSGDRVRWLADGSLEYLGRIDQQVKVRGYRIELGEIEARLQAHADVGEAVVVLRDKRLVGYVVSSRDDSLAEELKAQLKDALPDYMVPSKILVLERFPLTPNGKVDRKALPEPVWESQSYQAPTTPEEQALAAIWQQVLGLEQVGLHDNFFELGGDSIVSIQVVSRARQAGLALTPKDLFQHQTLQALARVAKPVEGQRAIDQGPVNGELPLTPIQAWFFEQPIPQRHHWNQSILLKAAQPLDSQALNNALQALVVHHDALRLSWQQHGDSWTQSHRDLSEQALLWEREATTAEEITAHCDAAQASLDLQNGPLLRAVHIRLADGTARLLLVVHHLVVDGVSWRILLEDLQTAYAGQPLPAKTSAYKHWAEHLQAFAQGEVLQAEVAYWQQQLAGPSDQFPEDGTPGAGIESLTLTLDKTRTAQLLKTANAAYRTRIDDLLLTALARTLCRWNGQASVLVDLEGHGREELFADLDLTRTVGWFTSLYPVRLSTNAELAMALKASKETLRNLPHKGLGFGLLRYLGTPQAQAAMQALPRAEITFNYLGQFDGSFAEDGLLQPASESAGREEGTASGPARRLEINGQVYGGELSLSWRFDASRHSAASVQALLDEYRQELDALLDHCQDCAAGGVTPSDFPLVRLSQAQLDGLPLSAGEIEDIYPLAPMQQGLLFHSLYAPEAGTYVNQLCVDVDDLDVQRFRAAWNVVLTRHGILRTGFVWRGDLPEPLQLVRRQLEVPLQVLDYRGRDDVQSQLQQYASADHARGFELGEAPLLRLTLIRYEPQRHRLIWTSHHLLLDGWSSAQLIGEVLQAYADPQSLRPVAGGYRQYIQWLQAQDAVVSETFWRERLSLLDEPCLLANTIAAPAAGEGPGNWKQAMTAEQTARLQAFAHRQRITLNTLVQGAWLLLLQRYTGLECACTGVTVAGRPTQLEGAESWLGLFINTLPLLVKLDGEQAVGEFLRSLQADNLALREHEHTPLYAIQGWAGQGGQGLFDTLVVFENYPVDAALRQAADSGPRFGPLEQLEMTNYPLALTVNLGECLEIGYSYHRSSFDQATLMRLDGQLRQILLNMAHDADVALGRIQLNDEAALQQLAQWSEVQQSFPDFVPVSTRIAAQAALRPDAVAISH
uniref:non-ribosomal peptide synthetase n=1 Tax=Pseudomonas akapageensis TaxID=2609961 RepID=UPI00140BE72A